MYLIIQSEVWLYAKYKRIRNAHLKIIGLNFFIKTFGAIKEFCDVNKTFFSG